MKQYFIEILLLTGNERGKLPWFLILTLIVSVLDLVGLGLIIPYSSLLLDQGEVNSIYEKALEVTGLSFEKGPLLMSLGFFLIGIFLLKSIATVWIQYKITDFGEHQRVRLQIELMRIYQNLPYTEYVGRNSSEYIYNVQVLTEKVAGCVLWLLRIFSDGIIALAIVIFLIFINGPILILTTGDYYSFNIFVL